MCEKVISSASFCRRSFVIYRAMLLTLPVFTAGCAKEEEKDQGPQEVVLDFKAFVGDTPFACGVNYTEVGALNSDVSFTDLRFYVHDVSLIDTRGQSVSVMLRDDELWQKDQVALLDFEDGCGNGNAPINERLIGDVPRGQYAGLSFTVGVPTEMNSPETVLEG